MSDGMYLLEFMLLFLIGFRWFVTSLGLAFLLYLVYWLRKGNKKTSRTLNVVAFVVFIMVVFSAYTILVIDLRIRLPTF